MYLGTELRQWRKNIKQDTKEFYEKYKKFKILSLPIILEKINQYLKKVFICICYSFFNFCIFNTASSTLASILI
jgi:hypothetical protein